MPSPTAPTPVPEPAPAAPRTAPAVPVPPVADAAPTRPLTATPSAPAASPATPAPTARPHRRRTVLLGSAAIAAVALPVTAGALLLQRGDASASTADGTFTDVGADDDALEAYRWADANGVQPALEDGSYAPGNAVTRGDLALALHRFAGAPAVPSEAVPAMLADLDTVPERRDAQLWLFGHAALWGDLSLCVHPDEPASRESASQTLTALLRPSLSARGHSQAVTDLAAADADPTTSALAWLRDSGLLPSALTGLKADATAVTRGELAQLLFRADQVLAGAPG
ncbi:hypothetical protein [Brachybacterium sp. SGAir0954]|uniref:hypothetical protein n=1 Tax=Brachybacterium sp. SGAir0954 TaxID=2571029 RepID=UPI0010F846A8|nr:hypothetical protein [Brachybacterium sp. SGAir0954]